MKILQVIPHFGIGGAEAMCKHLSIALKKAGCDVKVVSLFDIRTQNTEELEREGVEISYLNKKQGLDISVLRKLKKEISTFSPDIIHSHLSALKYAFFASSKYETPIIYTVHSVAKYDSGKISQALNSLFLKSGRVRFVALSREIQKTIIDTYKLTPNDVPVVLNGVPVGSYERKKKYSLSESTSIVNVASFQPVKNQIELLKAILLLRAKNIDCKLSLYGDGVNRHLIEEFIIQNDMGDFVCLHGFKGNVPELLPNYDIFVLPSLLEGIPLSIIEAMATAMPIVASGVGGILDMIEDEKNGLLCEPNADSIAQKLEQAISSQVLRESIGNTAFVDVERFSSKSMCNGYISVYNALCAK